MRVLLINSVCGIGSTGRICEEIARAMERKGHEVKIAYGRGGTVPENCRRFAVRIGSDADVRAHAMLTRLTDKHGLGSRKATAAFLKWTDEYDPQLLWLHNIHGYYINYEMLFDWIKSRKGMAVRWTLHDCWAFTGHCTHFSYVKCYKWQSQCTDCPQLRRYPECFFGGNVEDNFTRKRRAFTGVENMTIISPSRWLADLVKESFLSEYPVVVRNNTIDTNVFMPTPSNFRKRYGLENKFVVLGVSSVWDERKGLDDIKALAQKLDDRFVVVVVGVNEKQKKSLPKDVLGFAKTNSASELAAIYTAADVFVNPTYEDNYPTVNLEAKACGTPVITYRTGGSPESAEPQNVIDVGDVDGLAARIKEMCEQKSAAVAES